MTASKKKAIVLGATGLVGLELVEKLQQAPEFEAITLVVRKESQVFNTYDKVNQFIMEDFLMLNDEDVNGHTHAFSCLGTTLKNAGSKQGFYAVDYEINAHLADLVQDKHIHLLLVSALGANSNSPIFYNKVKGQLEDYIESLELEKLSIFRPSLLIGKRSEVRFIEDLGQSLFKFIENKLQKPFKYKPVTAEQLAHTMVVAALTQIEAFKRYDNLSIQKTR